MTTYLKDLTQSISRYGRISWQNWFKGCLEAQLVCPLGAKNLSSMRGKGKLNMLDDPIQYNVSDIGKNNPLSCLLVQHQLFSMSYFNECSQLQKMSKIVYLYVKSLFLQYSFMNCSSDQSCVC